MWFLVEHGLEAVEEVVLDSSFSKIAQLRQQKRVFYFCHLGRAEPLAIEISSMSPHAHVDLLQGRCHHNSDHRNTVMTESD